MALTYPAEVTDVDFAPEVEEHEGVTVVHFWAGWSRQLIAPIVEEIAEEYDERVKVAKLDVDENQNTAMRFNVGSIPSILLFKNGQHVDTIPSILFFKNGQHVDTMVGVVSKAHIVEKIEQHLG